MQWDDTLNAGFTRAQPYLPLLQGEYGPEYINVKIQIAKPDSLFHSIRRMIAVHKDHRAFGWGDFEWLNVGTSSIAAYKRTYRGETMLILNNISDKKQTAHLQKSEAINAFTLESISLGSLTLRPYQYLWLITNERQ